MKKFNRIFKRLLKQIKSLLTENEYLKLIEYFIFMLKKNKEIIENKLAGGINNLKLEKIQARRGEVFIANFGYNIGSEFRYVHYCVILKVDGTMAIVLPLTSKSKNASFSINLGTINKIGNNKDSYALLNQIKAISRARLLRPVFNGKTKFIRLNSIQLNLIDNEMKRYFNLT